KGAAVQAFENVLASLNERYKAYCTLSGTAFQPINYPHRVLEYAELFRMAQRHFGGELERETQNMASELLEKGEDKRFIPLRIAERLCEIAEVKTPTIVVFFAAPYCPHNTLKAEVPEEKALLGKISKLVSAFGKETGENYRVMQFFPSLSDSSYLKIDDDAQSLETLMRNFPAYSRIYPLPFDRIRLLNLAGLNYGCFGKDAHKWTERVYLPYSFEIFPKLILKTVEEFLMNGTEDFQGRHD
ncbi:MAG TPA: peptidase M20, partial [Clostridia bacterium]|nr:peptidase M20 [Clostridia bacterium]